MFTLYLKTSAYSINSSAFLIYYCLKVLISTDLSSSYFFLISSLASSAGFSSTVGASYGSAFIFSDANSKLFVHWCISSNSLLITLVECSSPGKFASQGVSLIKSSKYFQRSVPLIPLQSIDPANSYSWSFSSLMLEILMLSISASFTIKAWNSSVLKIVFPSSTDPYSVRVDWSKLLIIPGMIAWAMTLWPL